ncbi:hypothetical protein [Robertkochia sediminum]|uniref:hypothetical protein n=1 Tax=Robertkochia sediminum TaxID=2785326 RepID=UPI001931E700|nr:hypothetical protein [Robertkochia sediminum]MBL7473374.1 hypothetical protein [Robertkochia sediminum]
MNNTTSYINMYERLSSQTMTDFEKIQMLIENENDEAPDQLYSLLRDMEDMFRRNKLVQFMDIAKYRAKLRSSQIAIDRRIPRPKLQLEAASNLLPTITKTVKEAMKPLEEGILEIKATVRELVEEAYDSNLVHYNNGLNFSEFIQALWRLLIKDERFKPKTLGLLDRISKNEALELLAEEVNRRNALKQA